MQARRHNLKLVCSGEKLKPLCLFLFICSLTILLGPNVFLVPGVRPVVISSMSTFVWVILSPTLSTTNLQHAS